MTTPVELRKWGGFASVRLVPDGALASLPTGPTLPAQQPRMQDIKAAIAALEVEDARLVGKIAEVDEPGNSRPSAALRAALSRVRYQLATLRSRQTVLACA